MNKIGDSCNTVTAVLFISLTVFLYIEESSEKTIGELTADRLWVCIMMIFIVTVAHYLTVCFSEFIVDIVSLKNNQQLHVSYLDSISRIEML